MTPLLAAALAACAPQPEPRTVFDFMDDGFAREGVLTRCNQNRDETLNDEECANARRAAAALALEVERAREPALEQQSEAKLLALRERQARADDAEQDALVAARSAAEAAYEARWRDPAGPRAAGDTSPTSGPTFGTPVGQVLPSMSGSLAFDVYADGTDPLARPTLEIEAAEPPPNDFVIPPPALDVPELALVPRPFRDNSAQQ